MDEVVQPRQKAHHAEKMKEIVACEHSDEPENEEYFEIHSPIEFDSRVRSADTNEEERIYRDHSQIIQP